MHVGFYANRNKAVLNKNKTVATQLNEKFQEQEYENMTKIVQLEKQLSTNMAELTLIKVSVVVSWYRSRRLSKPGNSPIFRGCGVSPV